MSFTQNWFDQLGMKNFENLKNIINIHEPINFLEIGCYEGNCHFWMYKNILLNKNSKSTVIEPFGNGTGNSPHADVYELFKNNLAGHLDNITILRGYSNDKLPLLQNDTFDIIYVDGDHTAEQTYKDGINSWNLLKKRGIMIFDDYLWIGIRGIDIEYPWGGMVGDEDHPALGINRFLKEKEGKYELLGKEYGFKPECKIINLDKLNDKEYTDNYTNKFNYQLWIRKLI